MNIIVSTDKEQTAIAAAKFIEESATSAIKQRGQFSLAVSGGSTPRRMLELLSESELIDWGHVHLFQVDERVAPDSHSDRNATMLQETLLRDGTRSAATLRQVWLMPVNASDPVAEYQATLESVCEAPPVIDLIQLGLGDDGHTASLVPGDKVCDITDADIALTDEYKGRRRLTMTRPILERCRAQLWLIAGENKQTAMEQFVSGDKSIPANLFDHDNATVMCDKAACYEGFKA